MGDYVHALVLCDDKWHPAAIARSGLAALALTDLAFEWIEDAAAWSATRMVQHPLTVLVKANNISSSDTTPWMSDDVQQAFVDYVQAGNGLLVIHNGTAGYQECPVLRGLMGGVFVHHPPQCPVTVEPKAGHPLTLGSTPFTLKDEHYFMEMDDPDVDLFLTSASEHGAQPAGWRRQSGAGRVAVLTPGHNLEVWLHPAYQALIGNCLRWCGRLDEQ